jgi:hypothetical protein
VVASLKADEIAVNLKNTDIELEEKATGFTKKSVIIVTVIVLLAAAFAVGIYFAIEFSTK